MIRAVLFEKKSSKFWQFLEWNVRNEVQTILSTKSASRIEFKVVKIGKKRKFQFLKFITVDELRRKDRCGKLGDNLKKIIQ